jgi:hypothetical protein
MVQEILSKDKGVSQQTVLLCRATVVLMYRRPAIALSLHNGKAHRAHVKMQPYYILQNPPCHRR